MSGCGSMAMIAPAAPTAGDEQAVAADIRADVHEHEIGRDARREIAEFRRIEILRREQHPLFADMLSAG